MHVGIAGVGLCNYVDICSIQCIHIGAYVCINGILQ